MKIMFIQQNMWTGGRGRQVGQLLEFIQTFFLRVFMEYKLLTERTRICCMLNCWCWVWLGKCVGFLQSQIPQWTWSPWISSTWSAVRSSTSHSWIATGSLWIASHPKSLKGICPDNPDLLSVNINAFLPNSDFASKKTWSFSLGSCFVFSCIFSLLFSSAFK